MKTRAQVLAEKMARALAVEQGPFPEARKVEKADPLEELAAFVRENGVSVHIRYACRKYVVVVHSAAETRAADCEDPDLRTALRTALRDYSKGPRKNS